MLRLLMNSVDPSVAERGNELIVYGGAGKAARNWECFHAIVKSLKELDHDETLLIQSGKPVGVFRTFPLSPRVVMSTSMLVPHWATWEHFRELERKGLTMFGQATAASWAYIGTQGILQGTCETLGELSAQNFGGSLAGKLVLTSGLGGMGGAQPLAVTMNGGVVIIAETDLNRIKRRLTDSYCDMMANDIDEALALAKEAVVKKIPRSIALLGNAAKIFPEFVRRGLIPDVVTDQTAAHDLLNGYIPVGFSPEKARELRSKEPEKYLALAGESIITHVQAMLDMQAQGAIVFEYGNNIRAQARAFGLKDSFRFPGFVPALIRPLYYEGRGPSRWIALSGDPEDIYQIDNVILTEFAGDERVSRWIKFVQDKIYFHGLPARGCWLNYHERRQLGEIVNSMVKKGKLRAPIAFTRDHTEGGTMAAPTRETENLLDGSDAIADWPILNTLLNAVSGATLVGVQHGGGVGIGYSIHAGMTVIADGTSEAASKLVRVLTSDPALGIIRYADAGYPEAQEVLRKQHLKQPMQD